MPRFTQRQLLYVIICRYHCNTPPQLARGVPGSVVLPPSQAWHLVELKGPPGEKLPGKHTWHAVALMRVPLSILAITVVKPRPGGQPVRNSSSSSSNIKGQQRLPACKRPAAFIPASQFASLPVHSPYHWLA
jgi:hypothetical protein